MNPIIKNYNKILTDIRTSEKLFLRKHNSVKLVAVSKTFSDKDIKPLLKLDHVCFGENRVQEAHKKWMPLKIEFKNIKLHLIGPLQSNKVNQALEVFDCIQTIDRQKIAIKINESIKSNELLDFKKFEFMIQVNTGSEPQKSGIKVCDVLDFYKWCKKETNLNISGLMCIPPFNESPEEHFELLNDLANQCNLNQRSMGMSKDFNLAVKCGATHVRVGSGIFGNRSS